MSSENKRNNTMADDSKPKRVKKECEYGERCYRRNPAHFREFSHRHLESILDAYSGTGPYPIPDNYSLEKYSITEQLDVIVEKQFYTPWIKVQNGSDGQSSSLTPQNATKTSRSSPETTNTSQNKAQLNIPNTQDRNSQITQKLPENSCKTHNVQENLATQKDEGSLKRQESQKPLLNTPSSRSLKSPQGQGSSKTQENQRMSPKMDGSLKVGTREKSKSPIRSIDRKKDSDYRPIVPPTRRVEDFLNVVVPKGRMAAKHAASAPYHIFYTTITDARETHNQPFSITFQEILDRSLGELKCSLQINFMVEAGWLLAQYYFAGYSEKKLTILYGEECSDLKNINAKKPQVDAHLVTMPTPFGKHHTKMMVLCYEDGSLRVVVSTANLYLDDWENRTQGLWFSPRCPELPPDAMPHDGESPTMFKRSLLKYLSHYSMAALAKYVERVKRCDFSHINVFLVASAPGSHFDTEWGMAKAGALLRQHCQIPSTETQKWPLLAQASSLGSYGNQPKLWLTGDFLHNFTKIKQQPQTLQSSQPELKLIYPSLENVQQSHDSLLGGGCLPYAASAHAKQPWLNDFLYQWKATSTKRNRAMPHIKTYTRISPDSKKAAFYLLTSGNVSKAAWGTINKGNAALRLMSYEAGVLFLPTFVINEDFFPLEDSTRNRLILPYDVPPSKYTKDMSPWVSDYLCG